MPSSLDDAGVRLPVLAALMAGDPGTPALVGAAASEAERYGIDLGSGPPLEDDDQWRAKVDLLVADPVPVVSFTFGIPEGPAAAALTRLAERL